MSELPIILKDSREKEGFGYRFIASANCAGMEVATLKHGDYAIKGHLDLIAIERKQNISELCKDIGVNRKKFEAKLERMSRECKKKYLIVEDYYSSIYRQKYSKIHPSAILGTLNSFSLKYDIHIIFAGSAAMAQKIARNLLIQAYKYRLDGLL